MAEPRSFARQRGYDADAKPSAILADQVEPRIRRVGGDDAAAVLHLLRDVRRLAAGRGAHVEHALARSRQRSHNHRGCEQNTHGSLSRSANNSATIVSQQFAALRSTALTNFASAALAWRLASATASLTAACGGVRKNASW